MLSHPAWGAWIEIICPVVLPLVLPRRTPHGVRGLKLFMFGMNGFGGCRTPHGVRGLKYSAACWPAPSAPSHPAWGAWIEIHAVYGTS